MNANVARCFRCGSPLPGVGELAAVAERVEGEAARARGALESMKLAVPTALPAALRELGTLAPVLSGALACLSGRCRTPLTWGDKT
jgi:hypothetical protein